MITLHRNRHVVLMGQEHAIVTGHLRGSDFFERAQFGQVSIEKPDEYAKIWDCRSRTRHGGSWGRGVGKAGCGRLLDYRSSPGMYRIGHAIWLN